MLSKARIAIVIIVSLGLQCIIASANATTGTTPLAVSATVLSICGVAATPLIFGNYSATNVSATTATSTVTVTCSSGVNYTVALNTGTGSGATFASRILTNGSNTLSYNIYTNSTYTNIWGDGTSSTSTQSGTSNLLPQTYTVYGKIAASQQAPSGAYADTVTVSVNY